MALAYKNARAAVGTSYATVYTCPASTTAVVLLVQVTNVDGVNSADVSAQWLDASNSNVATRLVELVAVPAGAALNVIDNGPIVLEAGDQLQVKASATSDLEVSVAVSEIT